MSNDHFESTVSGLFSGCNFVSFSGALCGGFSAGQGAGQSALAVPHVDQVDTDEIAREKQRIFHPFRVKDGISPRNLEKAIRQVMNFYMGFVKNEKGIEIAIERLKLIESYQNRIQASNYHELLRANEAWFILRQCQLTTRAVKERRESGRITYRRSDYPDLSPEYNGRCLALWQEAGEPMISLLYLYLEPHKSIQNCKRSGANGCRPNSA